MKNLSYLILLSALVLLSLASCSRGYGCPYAATEQEPVRVVNETTPVLYCNSPESMADCIP